jgi:hypothetical protein
MWLVAVKTGMGTTMGAGGRLALMVPFVGVMDREWRVLSDEWREKSLVPGCG